MRRVFEPLRAEIGEIFLPIFDFIKAVSPEDHPWHSTP